MQTGESPVAMPCVQADLIDYSTAGLLTAQQRDRLKMNSKELASNMRTTELVSILSSKNVISPNEVDTVSIFRFV